MDFFSQLAKVFGAQTTGKKLGLLTAAAAVVAGFFVVFQLTNQPRYATLYAGMGADDAAMIVDALKEQRVDYHLSHGGTAIEVPDAQVYELRLALASKGLPRGGGVGFEIFDESHFGKTEFVERLNYQRALQGELARTISGLSQVEGARVHLSIPEKRLFSDRDEQARASIVLSLKPGKTVSRGEIDGIVHLVASSVEGLDAQSIVIVDQRGKPLTSTEGGDSVAGGGGSMLEFQRRIEGDLERRIESLLAPAIGPGKIIARVTADIDFVQTETTKELFDADNPVIRSEQRTEESRTGETASAGGVPGSKPESGGAGEGAGGSASTSLRETINYEISKTVNRVVAPRGNVKKLSVAVLVDGTYKAASDGGAEMEYTPRGDEEMAKLTALVRKAVGFDERRGDQLEVLNVPFEKPEAIAETEGLADARLRALAFEIARYAGVAVLILLFFIFVVRPGMRFVTSPSTYLPEDERPQELPEGGQIRQLQETLTKQLAEVEDQGAKISEEAVSLARDNPEVAIKIVRNWLDGR
ncbi:MAG: flagellar M-ring protein FliF [Myxococcales bacterium]|nr:flagellar M-ring protein FliF [Myxococcales bacterium]